jgi:hypothetical protein
MLLIKVMGKKGLMGSSIKAMHQLQALMSIIAVGHIINNSV